MAGLRKGGELSLVEEYIECRELHYGECGTYIIFKNSENANFCHEFFGWMA